MGYFEILMSYRESDLEKYLMIHDVNAEIHGQTLLYWAVHMGNLQVTKTLINRGADVNHKDSLARTPLEIACYFGYVEIAELLLESHAILNQSYERAKNGWDGHEQKEILELLRDWKK